MTAPDTIVAPRPPDARPHAARSRAGSIEQGLVEAILEQRLLPGTKLGEDELGQIYGASRTIVRQALQSLAREGIVVAEQNRGAFVAQPTPQDAHEVFEARKLIEPRIAHLAAAASGPRTAATLRAHLLAEREATQTGQDRLAIRLSGEFHLLIAAQSGHAIYESFLRQLVARSSLIILLYRSRSAPICGTDHHEAIARALSAADGPGAARLMVEHLHEIEQGLDLTKAGAASLSLSDMLGR